VLIRFRPDLLHIRREHLRYLAAYGLLLSLFNAAWTTAVDLTGAAVATVLVYCSAGFSVVLGWWFLDERLNRGKLLAVVCALGGCVLVSGALESGSANLSGLLIGILAGLCYAVYTLMGRSASQRGLNPWTTLVYTFSFAAGFLLIYNLLPGDFIPGAAERPADLFWLGHAWRGWGVLILLAAVPTVAGFGLYNVSLTYLPSSVANLIVTTEPAFTAVIAYFFLGERLNAVQIAGSLLILGGVVFLRLYEGRLAGSTTPALPSAAE
jgi:drug/metabolite transporter (DMT)-like permease